MKTFGRALPIAFLVLALAGCTKVSHTVAGVGSNPWTRPGVLRFAENGDPGSLNPMLASNAVSGDLSMFIYSYAVRYDQHGRPFPDALSQIPTRRNGDVSKNGLTLIYKLRRNIKWQDGVPLTCKDLRFTWQAVMNPHNNVVTTDGYRDIKSIDCSNPYVAIIHMKKPYAPFLQQLWAPNGNAPILPAHLLAKYNDDKGSLNTAPYNSMPIGSGPFRVVQWERGSQVRLERNPNFYLGKPKLREVVFKIMPDENTMGTALQTHEIDLLARGTGLNWPRYQALAADPKNGLKAVLVDSYAYTHVDFNLRKPIMRDRQVRLALAYATNRKEIIAKLLHGAAIPAYTDQNPRLSWAYAKGIPRHAYDPAKARVILRADGWRTGPGGIRVKGGRRLQFVLSTQTESTLGRAIQTFLQREWHDVGVEATVKNYPTNEFFSNSTTGVLQGGHYDAAIFTWVASVDPDDSEIYSGDNLAPHGQNALFWNDPRATAAMNAALVTINRAARKADYRIVQEQMARDVPTIILDFERVPYVYNTDLKGFTPSPVISPFWDPWEYSI
ncbi:MAG: peptide ABC transporter substrate-binding protein [Vulcanimicrobiaceae bacterium]